MSLITPLSVQKLQTALHDKAKGSPNFRFYALYDKVYREDVMAFAYECCKANRGAAGVDGQTFEDIEEYGVKKWLDELTQELRSRTYHKHGPTTHGSSGPNPAIASNVAGISENKSFFSKRMVEAPPHLSESTPLKTLRHGYDPSSMRIQLGHQRSLPSRRATAQRRIHHQAGIACGGPQTRLLFIVTV